MRIGLVQIEGTADKSANIALLEAGITQAAERGATLVVCPEASSQAFGTGRLDTQAEEFGGPFSSAIVGLAERLGVTIVAGMFRPADAVQREGKTIHRVYNTALIAAAGAVPLGYDKIHTYDAFNFAESDTVRPGEGLVTFEHEGTTCGVATCFDVRYPALFQDLARRGADVIVVPTSWADGPEKLAQWRVLARARALDSGAFIAAAAQARPGGAANGGQASGPTGIGHSLLVDPAGGVIAEAGYEPDVLVVDIDPARAEKTRRTIPIL